MGRIIFKKACLRCLEEYSREKKGVMAGEDLLPCLRDRYLQWSNSLRQDLQALEALGRRQDEEEPWDIKAELAKLDEEAAKKKEANDEDHSKH